MLGVGLSLTSQRRRAAAWTPASLGGLLAEYDFLKSGAESASVLYDRKPGGGADGTVGVGATYSAEGLTTGGASGWATTGVAGNAWRTLLVYVKPQASSGVSLVAQASGVGVLTPIYVDAAGTMTEGQVFPRLRDLNTSAVITADISTPSWPFSLAFVLDTPSRLYLSGVQPTIYDGQNNAGAFVPGTAPVSFGNNFVSTAANTNLYAYALLFDHALTSEEVQQCHDYVVAACGGRGITAGGPAGLTTNLLGFSGNSLTQALDRTQITPTGTWSRVSSHITGGTPATVVAKATQSLAPLYRPLAAKNYCQIWPSPNGTAADSYDAAVALSDYLRAAGWKVSLVTAISAGPPAGTAGYDAVKNTLNALYDGRTYGPGVGTLADVLCDLRPETDLSADGAYLNATYFPDGLHPSAAGNALAYPIMTDAFDAIP